MGEHRVQDAAGAEEQRAFVRALLDDLQALERLLEEGRIERGARRIGAEQEMVLADAAGRPVPAAGDVLARLDDPSFTTELGRFNLEANLPPLELEPGCLRRMEADVEAAVGRARAAAAELDARVVLCGILPTFAKEHLTLDWMTPAARYRRLNEVMTELRGGEFRTVIKGLDELQETHDNVMFEACNTSFQVHFQVGPDEFPRLYNLAQVVTAPVLAAAVNSPVFLRRRLWHETRVALFQQSLDARSDALVRRGTRRRVHFGNGWVERSVLEIFREDVSRFRVLLATELGESALAQLEKGEVPALRALCLHNGTVYRWNRPCYGVHRGVPHLRIENRVLPAGPTVLDEVANAAFLLGLLLGLGEEHRDVREAISFDDAKGNFMAAARYGLDARMRWLGGETLDARALVLERLLPLAREALAARLDAGEADRYLDVVEARAASGRTGARWALDSLAAMGDERVPEEAHRALALAMLEHGPSGVPVHAWPLAEPPRDERVRASWRTVGQVMTRDLFTLHPDDVVDLAASLMDWEHIRHVPVEDKDGRLVGIVTHRQLLRMLARGGGGGGGDGPRTAVREIMAADPVTVSPDTPTAEAIDTMRRERVGCLPVVEDGRLVGVVSESDFVRVAKDLLDRWLRAEA